MHFFEYECQEDLWSAKKKSILIGATVHMNPVPGRGFAVSVLLIICASMNYLPVVFQRRWKELMIVL